jgi:biopolymer transport protein ExbB
MNETVAEVAVDPTFLQSVALFMDEGGIFMWIILFVWAFGLAISLERIKSMLLFDTNGSKLMALIKGHVVGNEVKKAIELCSNTKALLPYVLRAGLKRANQSKEQIQDAIEAAMLDVIPQVEKRLGYLGLVANVSTLIGLLGTIYGLIQSFAAVATADPASKAKLLALGISKAMNTTALGLISAISIMVIHTILTGKSEKILSEIEGNSVKLIDLLGTKKHYVSQKQAASSEQSLPQTPPVKDVA